MKTYKIKPMKEFTNLVEKELRKASVSSMIPALLWASANSNLYFHLTSDGGFVTTHRDYKLIVNHALRIVQYN